MTEPAPDNLAFEQALEELERVVRDLEDGTVGLEESLARYERGVALLKHCYGRLQSAEQRIQLLSGLDETGKPVARPFEHSAAVGSEKAEPRRRSKKANDSETAY